VNVYAVILNEPNEAAWQKVKAKWPDRTNFILTDRIAFIATEELTITNDVAEAVGVSKEGGISGVVFDASRLAGWNDSGLVEWLGKVS